jgi:hypothetical protein
MYNSETNSFLKTRFITICVLFFALSFNCNANDVERINKLEKEVQELKQRLTFIESSLPSPTSKAKIENVSNVSGWKSISAWRQLKKGMSPSEVAAILGEPDRIRVSVFTYWSYTNGGRLDYLNDQLNSWHEPN